MQYHIFFTWCKLQIPVIQKLCKIISAPRKPSFFMFLLIDIFFNELFIASMIFQGNFLIFVWYPPRQMTIFSM